MLPRREHEDLPNAVTRDCLAHDFASVIICTRSYGPLLNACLDSVAAQKCQKFETLLVLNTAPDDEFARAVSGRPVRLLFEPRPGVSAARNRAVQEARGSIVAITDDDVVADPNWLHDLLGGFTDPGVMCVTGRVVPEGQAYVPPDSARQMFFGERMTMPWRISSSDPLWFEQAFQDVIGYGCNWAFRKSFLEREARFPIGLGAGELIPAGDEAYMFFQVMKRGFSIIHSPSAVLVHHFPDDPLVRKIRAADNAAAALAVKLKILAEERGFRRRMGKIVWRGITGQLGWSSRKPLSGAPSSSLLSRPERLRAYFRSPWLYWRSRGS